MRCGGDKVDVDVPMPRVYFDVASDHGRGATRNTVRVRRFAFG
jgi:hypothetical protein